MTIRAQQPPHKLARVDAVIVGAGFAGLYMLHRLRRMGLTTRVIERGQDVGGTLSWNRYPGARCDIESLDYQYSFDDDLVREWRWTERYAAQPEILAYLNHVADRFDLRPGITFGATVESADWTEAQTEWTIGYDTGETIRTKFLIMATGCLSVVKEPSFPGLRDFQGQWFHTGQWPHEPVEFNDKAVAVVGTGSSGIQAIPRVAEQAKRLYVLQRTPNYSMPAHNRQLDELEVRAAIERFAERRRLSRESESGIPLAPPTQATFEVTEGERRRRYEEGWQRGGIGALSYAFTDFFTDEKANLHAQEFARERIREIVRDPAIAERLCPHHHIGTKRTCTDTGYFETYNRANVELIDARQHPLEHVTRTGLQLRDRALDVDIIVFAIGFDAITGALTDVDIRGIDGQSLREKWSHGPRTLLGLQTAGFPNLFMVTGPGSPSVLSNMVVSIEQHVDFITECLDHLYRGNLDRIEASPEAEERWMVHVAELGASTLYPQAESWYVGANIPGKPRTFMPYVAGCGQYRRECEQVVARGYEGFILESRHSAVTEGSIA